MFLMINWILACVHEFFKQVLSTTSDQNRVFLSVLANNIHISTYSLVSGIDTKFHYFKSLIIHRQIFRIAALCYSGKTAQCMRTLMSWTLNAAHNILLGDPFKKESCLSPAHGSISHFYLSSYLLMQ